MTIEHEREQKAPEIEQEIEDLRSELGALIDELNRRRREVIDVRLQLRRHGGAVALVLGVVVLSVIARNAALRRRRARRFTTRAANLARVLALLSQEDPRQVRRAVEGRRDPKATGVLAQVGVALAPRLLRSLNQR